MSASIAASRTQRRIRLWYAIVHTTTATILYTLLHKIHKRSQFPTMLSFCNFLAISTTVVRFVCTANLEQIVLDSTA